MRSIGQLIKDLRLVQGTSRSTSFGAFFANWKQLGEEIKQLGDKVTKCGIEVNYTGGFYSISTPIMAKKMNNRLDDIEKAITQKKNQFGYDPFSKRDHYIINGSIVALALGSLAIAGVRDKKAEKKIKQRIEKLNNLVDKICK